MPDDPQPEYLKVEADGNKFTFSEAPYEGKLEIKFVVDAKDINLEYIFKEGLIESATGSGVSGEEITSVAKDKTKLNDNIMILEFLEGISSDGITITKNKVLGKSA